MNWTQNDLGARAGRHFTAISEWERGGRTPPRGVLERLAKSMRWPVDIFAEGGPMPSAVIRSEAGYPLGSSARRTQGVESHYDETAEGPGWMFGDPSEAEEQFRTYIRQIERTHRAMIANPAALDASSLRELQLTAVRLAETQCELAKRPIPEFMRRVRNELINGTFG